MLIAFRFWERFILWVAIEFTDFSPCSKTYVRLKFRFESFLTLINSLPRFVSSFFCVCFLLFIYLFRIQQRAFVQREDIYTTLCPEPMMVLNYAKYEFKLSNVIRPIWFCNIRSRKEWNEKKLWYFKEFSNYQLYRSIYSSIYLFTHWNFSGETSHYCKVEGSHLETGITFQNH